jgi:hypothetical protein
MQYAGSIITGSMQAVCRQYAVSMQAICMQYAGSMQAICMQYAGSMQAVCRQYAGSKQQQQQHQTTKGRGGEGKKVGLITTSQRSWDVVKN